MEENHHWLVFAADTMWTALGVSFGFQLLAGKKLSLMNVIDPRMVQLYLSVWGEQQCVGKGMFAAADGSVRGEGSSTKLTRTCEGTKGGNLC